MGKTDTKVSEETAWKWLQKKHSAICQYLEPFEEKGRKRGDKGEYWWELRACAYYDKFEKNKIIWADISNSNSFNMTQDNNYLANTGYMLPSDDYFLLGWLNSNACQLVFFSLSTTIRGGFYRYIKQYINIIPIPKGSNTQKDKIAQLAKDCQKLAEERYEVENDFRLDIPELCPEDKDAKLNNKLKSWWLLSFDDFKKEIKKQFKQETSPDKLREWRKTFADDKAKIQLLSSQLANKEQQLNSKVYALFKLTDEEVDLLESSIQ